MTKANQGSRALLVLGVLVVLGAGGYGVRAYNALKTENAAVQEELRSTQNTLATARTQNDTLNLQLQGAQSTLTTFTDQVNGLSNTIGTLQKLQSTDKQLLEKYSKVYFLNENYIPAALGLIDPNFTLNKTKQYQILSDVQPFLQNLLSAAKQAGMDLEVESAYRSFGTQSSLKSSYKVTYGAGTANSFSAEQGYSEHQLGTAVDFTTPKIGDTLDGFDKTPEYAWLKDNAYRYGFVISYPQNNTFYVFEPWHWRFVGTALATTLHSQGKNFYDLDQRDIDTYLAHLFD